MYMNFEYNKLPIPIFTTHAKVSDHMDNSKKILLIKSTFGFVSFYGLIR